MTKEKVDTGQVDEKTLIALLKQDSEQAFGALYDRYWHAVCHFASLYLTQTDEVEDAVHDVFIKLWEARLTLHEDSDLKAFLFIVTRNLVFSRWNTLNHTFYNLTVINALADDSDTSSRAEVNDLAERLDRLVAQMPPQRRLVFDMSRRRYMSYSQIATELGITVKTVERHINEALKFLKTHLISLLIGILQISAFFSRSLWG